MSCFMHGHYPVARELRLSAETTFVWVSARCR